MANELPRPGVEVIQQFTSAAPTLVRPTLIPFVTGPGKEVIDVTTSDGLLNSQAKQGTYSQLPKTISQLSFPSPRGNIAEVNVEEDTIGVFFLNGGALQQLARNPGESFLTAWNKAGRATLHSLGVDPASVDINGKVLVLAVDIPSRLNTTQDVVVTFASSSSTLTAQQVADQINNAVGEDVATVIPVTGSSPVRVKIEIVSPTYGALSSLTLRQGGSANIVLGFAPANEYRVEGSGFRAQDQLNNTTLSPWVEWTRGSYQLNGTAQSAFPTETAVSLGAGLMYEGDEYSASFATALTFVGSGSIDLKAGDEFWADGAKPNSAQIMKVEATRFKLGTVNSKLSVYDDDGKVVSAVYDASNINTLFSSAPFSPKYSWFRARNLNGNVAASAAYLLGTTSGQAAATATITAGSAPTLPLSLSGLNLRMVVTIDGVEGEEQVFTFSGPPFASVADIATAIGTHITGVVALDSAGKLALSTTRTGATQALLLKGTSTALTALGFTPATDVTAAGKDVEFLDVPPALLTSVVTFANLEDRELKVKTCTNMDSLSPTWSTTRPAHTFGAGLTTLAAVVAEINLDTAFCATDVVTGLGLHAELDDPDDPGAIVIKGTWTGSVAASTKGLQFDVTSTCKVTSPLAMDFDPAGGGIGEDAGEENLAGLQLKFKLNGRPKVYTAVFTSNSLVDAVATINEAAEWPVATIGGSLENKLLLTSTLKGYASIMEVVTDEWTAGTRPLTQKAAAALGFDMDGQTSEGSGTAGTGRPNPDLSLDVSGSVVLGAEILRDVRTGTPFNPGMVDTYIQYVGLRKDLSPEAAHPGILSLSDIATLQTVLNPLTSRNPLGLGMYFEMINAPGLVCTGMGVAETSAAEPFGTPLAYAGVASYIQSQEVYAIAPLTHSEAVAQIFIAHCLFMSSPENKGERILFFNPSVPTRAVDDVMATGTAGNTTATENQFVGDVNPVAALVAAGVDISGEIPVGDNVFVELVVNTPNGQETRNYSVKSVNGVVWDFRTTFATGENTDAFFTTSTLDESLVNAAWKMAIRGDLLLIPGSTLPDKDKIAETVAAKAAAYKQRRAYYVFPDKVKATLGGTEELLDAFYSCAAIVGMIAAYAPQQGFTNLPMGGFSGVVGSNDTYTNKQLNVMAAGGVYILVQDAQGAPLVSRHQLSTNTTSIETRELSITKDVDYVAKFMRTGLRNFIGTFNITQPFLDTLSTVIQGMNSFLEENGVLISGDLNNLIQSKDQPDTVLVDETLDVPYPCNYIRLTLAI